MQSHHFLSSCWFSHYFWTWGAHSYCRTTLADPSVHCGNAKHDLFFEILDKKVNRVCINTKMCFSQQTRAIMKELNQVIVVRTSGLSLDYLGDFLAQFYSLPQDLIDMLKINIGIASGPRLFFSKYFRHHFSIIDVCLPVEVKDFLLQEFGKYSFWISCGILYQWEPFCDSASIIPTAIWIYYDIGS